MPEQFTFRYIRGLVAVSLRRRPKLMSMSFTVEGRLYPDTMPHAQEKTRPARGSQSTSLKFPTWAA